MKITKTTCEYQTAPLSIDVLQPRLSWYCKDDRRGIKQTAYQIMCASSATLLQNDTADIWDSGKVDSAQSVHIEYAGPALQSRQRVYWKVRVWDSCGDMSEWSEIRWWEMGLLSKDEWKASWIAAPLAGGPYTTIPCPYMRKEFACDTKPVKARLYVTALGLYECSINGERIGDDVFAPGWTDYRTRVQYRTYDVTENIQAGENVLGSLLGDGWYCGHIGWICRQFYGDRPCFLAQLEITDEAGEITRICTDSSWRTAFGPLLESDLLMGESYDARHEYPGWNTPGFICEKEEWWPVKVYPAPDISYDAQRGPVVRRMCELEPLGDPRDASRRWRDSKVIFDFGQNMVGRVRLRVKGPAGTTLTVRYAEMLDEKGGLYTENLRAARATDHFTLRGNGEEVFEPHFTFHGFRYAEVSGIPKGMELTHDSITGIVLYSDTPRSGTFECSEQLVNQLQSNIEWGQRGNFVDIPTDCPQRDERLGWTGDAQVFIRTAASNMHVAHFFTKWLQDLADAQHDDGSIPPVAPSIDVVERDGGPAWADAIVICPWTIYQCYGDRRILETHYETMRQFIDYLSATAKDFIRVHDPNEWQGFGDWLSIDADTPKDLIGTAFFAYSAYLMSRIAKVLDKEKDAKKYAALSSQVKDAFDRKYFDKKGECAAHTQTAYVLALHFSLLPEELRVAAAQHLVDLIKERDMHLSTGFVGAPYLTHVLSDNGYSDIACELLMQKSWPSWLYAVTQGATTIWERWDGWTHDKGFQDPGMNSFNHYAYGSIGDWLYQRIAGIDTDKEQPGFKHIIMRPIFTSPFEWVKRTLETPYGPVTSAWEKKNGTIQWEIEIPPNAHATVFLPIDDVSCIMESGTDLDAAKCVAYEKGEDGMLSLKTGSGKYCFEIKR